MFYFSLNFDGCFFLRLAVIVILYLFPLLRHSSGDENQLLRLQLWRIIPQRSTLTRSPFYGVLQLHLMNLRITRKLKLSHYRFYPPISGTKMTFPCRKTSAIYHRSRVSSPMICFSSRTLLPYPTCFLNRILYPTAITCYSDQVLLIVVSDLHPGP